MRCRSGSGGGLRAETRGAVLIAAVPMMCVMAGLVYYVVGVGNQLVARERLQDAADAAALSAAVMHARGMNMLALVNQTMAAIVAVLVVTRMLQVVMATAIAVAAALAFGTAGASLTPVPAASDLMSQAARAFEQLQASTTPVLQSLHVFELGVKYALPAAAEARVARDVAAGQRDAARFGFLLPGDHPLPVEKADFRELCDRGTGVAADLLHYPTDEVLGHSGVAAVLGPGLDLLGKSFSTLFCQPGGVAFPGQLPDIPLSAPIARNVPELEVTAQCTAASPDGFIVGSQTRAATMQNQQNACEQSAGELARAAQGDDGGPSTTCAHRFSRDVRAEPEAQPRSCQPCRGHDGQACDEFMAKAAAAARVCRPDRTRRHVGYSYQLRSFEWRARLLPVAEAAGGEVLYRIDLPEAPQHRDEAVRHAAQPPCGQGGTLAESYNAQARYREDGEYARDELLCEQPHFHPSARELEDAAGELGLTLAQWQALGFEKPHWQPQESAEGPVLLGRWQAATFMHSCDERIESLADLVEPPRAAAAQWQAEPPQTEVCGRGEMLPHRMRRAPGVRLGDEPFQRRAVVFGETRDRRAREQMQRLTSAVSAGAEGPAAQSDSLREQAFLAQAEYYYDTAYDAAKQRTVHDPAEWLWSMNWRARLRRVRLGQDAIRSGAAPVGPAAEVAREVGHGCEFDAPSADAPQACAAASSDCSPRHTAAMQGLPALAEELWVH